MSLLQCYFFLDTAEFALLTRKQISFVLKLSVRLLSQADMNLVG